MYYITSKKHLAHSSGSNSRYKGGFTKDGKNTSAYNHDYYIHNKDKWQDNVPTRDPYNPYNPSGFGNTTTNTGYGGSGYQYSGEPINIKSPAEYIRDFLHKHGYGPGNSTATPEEKAEEKRKKFEKKAAERKKQSAQRLDQTKKRAQHNQKRIERIRKMAKRIRDMLLIIAH